MHKQLGEAMNHPSAKAWVTTENEKSETCHYNHVLGITLTKVYLTDEEEERKFKVKIDRTSLHQ